MKKLLFLLSSSLLFSNSIVIYNNNLSFVDENRDIVKKTNSDYIYINNLSFDIINSSINISSKDLKIDSFELLKPLSFDKKLLKLNLNKEVDFIVNKEIKSGKLRQIEPRVIVESEGKFYLISDINSLIFKKIPKSYKKKPYLRVKAKSNKDNFKVNLKYLLENISWSSNYILNINENGLSLKAYISLKNNSSKSFKDYNIAFVAGKLNRVNRYRYEDDMPYVKSSVPMRAESISVNIETKKIDSYYIYRLPYKDSIREKSSKNFLLFVADNIKYTSYYIAKSRYLRRGEEKLSFIKEIEFKNSKENNLAKAMPEGIVRIYSKDIYLGEDYIKNTPVGEDIKLKLGTEFDLRGKSRVIEFKANKNYQKSVLEYSIKNNSDKEKIVKIKEAIPSYNNSQIDFNTTCKNECIVKKLNAFLREYEIRLKGKSSYKFKRSYEIYYQ